MIRNLLIILTRNAVTLAGTAITTASAVVFATLFSIDLLGKSEGPYMGILGYLIVPAVFVFGLILIPAGIFLEKRQARKAAARGAPAAGARAGFPVIDLNHDRTRNLVLAFVALTAINVVLLSTATYEGVEVLESTRFCGTTCHTVMEPEYTAYRRSPHARVKCVACHVGPGGGWFVRSKLSGVRQFLAVTFGSYPRPIPVPVRNLRPTRDTCGQCHSPERFSGDRLKVITHHADDEVSTPAKTVLMMHVGGWRGGVYEGIHWHADPAVRIRYLAGEDRRTIADVEATLPDGTVRIYKSKEPPSVSQEGAAGAMSWRMMDCIDCHNRPAHVSRTPESEVDQAIEEGQIDRSLPFVRREAVRVLRGTYPDREGARPEMAAALAAFYRAGQAGAAANQAQIEKTGSVLGEIYSRNIFPEMKVSWGTYPSDAGHTDSPGCFRCHDEDHVAADGRTISQDCALCHAPLAVEEAEPKILRELQP